jgi:ABC-type multidrug transport system fused ATPase/permease subunit
VPSDVAPGTQLPSDSVGGAAPTTQSPAKPKSGVATAESRLKSPMRGDSDSPTEQEARLASVATTVGSEFAANSLQVRLEQLDALYVDEKALRRRLSSRRRRRAALLTTIFLSILVLLFWAFIVELFVEWNVYYFNFKSFQGVLLVSGYVIASVSIIGSVFVLGWEYWFRPVREIKDFITTTVQARSTLLATFPENKTVDYIQRMRLDVDTYKDSSRRLRWTNNILQIVVIIGSLLAATFAGAGGNNPTARWGAVIAGAFASFAASMIAFFKFRERSFSLEQAASSIESELNSYDLNGGRYRRLEEDEKQPELVEAIEVARSELRQREAALGTETTK